MIGKKMLRLLIAGFLACGGAGAALAQSCTLTAADRTRFQAEHLFGGQPTAGDIQVRRAYVAQYDESRRGPRWVAWRATSAYRDTPARRGKYDRFRADPDITRPVRDEEYTGSGFHRGHITPFFISGGDRNGNGLRATFPPPPSDPFDECTIFEVNYLSNISPQQPGFNGAGGLWFALETIERTEILRQPGANLQIIAGTIFGPSPQMIGPDSDIGVPDMFYRILVSGNRAVAFLFIHGQPVGSRGCPMTAQLETCIVTVADIEQLTGADFFNSLSDDEERALEGGDGLANWRALRPGR